MRSFIPSAIAAVATALLAQTAFAATYRVGSGAGCTHTTIQAAITDAVATAADDEIRVSNTSWTGQALAINAAQGAVTLRGGYPNCTFSTPVAGARTLLSGNNADPVLRINASPSVTLRSLDLQGGRSSDNGGGIRYTTSAAATLVLEDTWVRNNNAVAAGGGLSIENANAQLAPDQVRVDLRGASSVLGNMASGGNGIGGGIHCVRASVAIAGSTHVSQNQARKFGGGINADDCKVTIGSTGVAGAVLWANEVEDIGGGAYARGRLASIDIHAIDALQPARVLGNRGYAGAALAANAGAVMRLFDVNVEQNIGVSDAIWVNSYGPGDTTATRFLMQGGIDGAPSAAVPCAEPEACNRFIGNSVDADTGSVIRVRSDAFGQDAALASLRGTRIEGNAGRRLLDVRDAMIDLDGALVVGNTSGSLAYSSLGRLTLRASTIAGNALATGSDILYGPGSCADAQPGTRIERSIVWQPGHRLADFDVDFPVEPDCFRQVIAADFGLLAASPERVVADPQFVDPGAGDYRPAPGSLALDFAPASAADATRDRTPRVLDLADAPNRFGPQDLGAYERITDRIFADGFECESCDH
ncbi:MAG: hypothetical protein J0L88_11535 [Xanthomonadales bacterium]|nr:hypothetical protein [Xanthomonadales bacterium]